MHRRLGRFARPRAAVAVGLAMVAAAALLLAACGGCGGGGNGGGDGAAQRPEAHPNDPFYGGSAPITP